MGNCFSFSLKKTCRKKINCQLKNLEILEAFQQEAIRRINIHENWDLNKYRINDKIWGEVFRGGLN